MAKKKIEAKKETKVEKNEGRLFYVPSIGTTKLIKTDKKS